MYVPAGKPVSLPQEVLDALEQALGQPAGFASYEALRPWVQQTHHWEVKYHTLYTIVRTRFKPRIPLLSCWRESQDDVARPVRRGGADRRGAGSGRHRQCPGLRRAARYHERNPWDVQTICGHPVQVSDTVEIVLKPVYDPQGRVTRFRPRCSCSTIGCPYCTGRPMRGGPGAPLALLRAAAWVARPAIGSVAGPPRRSPGAP